MAIYIPANGEDFYGSSFASGMQNIDLHDHSGGPNSGVPLSSAGIANGSITAAKLNGNVIFGPGLVLNGSNQITLTAILASLAAPPANGILVNNASVISAVSLVGTLNQIDIANANGIGGPPTFTLPASLNVNAVNPVAGNFTISLNGVLQATFSPGNLNLNGGTISQIRTYSIVTAVLPAATGQQDLINLPAGSIWLFTAQSSIIDGNSYCLYIVYVPNVGTPTFLPITTTPPNQNVTFSVGMATTIGINNTSGAANRSFNVSGVRIF
jgi:hypothetical protein